MDQKNTNEIRGAYRDARKYLAKRSGDGGYEGAHRTSLIPYQNETDEDYEERADYILAAHRAWCRFPSELVALGERVFGELVVTTPIQNTRVPLQPRNRVHNFAAETNALVANIGVPTPQVPSEPENPAAPASDTGETAHDSGAAAGAAAKRMSNSTRATNEFVAALYRLAPATDRLRAFDGTSQPQHAPLAEITELRTQMLKNTQAISEIQSELRAGFASIQEFLTQSKRQRPSGVNPYEEDGGYGAFQ